MLAKPAITFQYHWHKASTPLVEHTPVVGKLSYVCCISRCAWCHCKLFQMSARCWCHKRSVQHKALALPGSISTQRDSLRRQRCVCLRHSLCVVHRQSLEIGPVTRSVLRKASCDPRFTARCTALCLICAVCGNCVHVLLCYLQHSHVLHSRVVGWCSCAKAQ